MLTIYGAQNEQGCNFGQGRIVNTSSIYAPIQGCIEKNGRFAAGVVPSWVPTGTSLGYRLVPWLGHRLGYYLGPRLGTGWAITWDLNRASIGASAGHRPVRRTHALLSISSVLESSPIDARDRHRRLHNRFADSSRFANYAITSTSGMPTCPSLVRVSGYRKHPRNADGIVILDIESATVVPDDPSVGFGLLEDRLTGRSAYRCFALAGEFLFNRLASVLCRRDLRAGGYFASFGGSKAGGIDQARAPAE